jgi:hypothetical protein
MIATTAATLIGAAGHYTGRSSSTDRSDVRIAAAAAATCYK